MDSLSSVTSSSVGSVQTYAAPSASATASPADLAAESVRVTFSDLARSLLAAHANSSTQSLQAAAAQNPLSPSLRYGTDGQLYTAAGLLQQFSLTQYLAQISDTATTGSTTGSGDSWLAASIGLPDVNESGSAALLGLLDAYQQIGLLGGLANLEVKPATPERTATSAGTQAQASTPATGTTGQERGVPSGTPSPVGASAAAPASIDLRA